jgi:HAD superfamily hydrolase (TIGR01509 family)
LSLVSPRRSGSLETRPTHQAATTVALFGQVELGGVRALLLDADGNLFPSEEPAFAASVQVVNRLLATLGCERQFDADELRLASTGKNFRTIASELASSCGKTLAPEDLERWVADEKTAVSRHLGVALTPDAAVLRALGELSARYQLAVVSSSALARLDVCFTATGLAELLPYGRRFSAEDSLPRPISKPDPAVYVEAAARLGISPDQGIAIEDSASGAISAVAAGFQTIGNLCFVKQSERAARIAELESAGAVAVVSSWRSIERMLLAGWQSVK